MSVCSAVHHKQSSNDAQRVIYNEMISFGPPTHWEVDPPEPTDTTCRRRDCRYSRRTANTRHNKPVFSMSDVKPKELARQLCMYEMNMFCNIEIPQLVCRNWYKEENRATAAPSIDVMTNWFNKVGRCRCQVSR